VEGLSAPSRPRAARHLVIDEEDRGLPILRGAAQRLRVAGQREARAGADERRRIECDLPDVVQRRLAQTDERIVALDARLP